MKKYSALLLIIASLVGLAWAGVLALRVILTPSPTLSSTSAPTVSTKDSDTAMQRLRRIDQVLGQIDQLPKLVMENHVGPFAQAPALALAPTNQWAILGKRPALTAKQPAMITERPVVSLVYLSTDMRRAVIDGHLYSTGDLVPGGGHLIEIGLNQLVIDVKGRHRVLKVPLGQVVGSTVAVPKEK